MRPCLMQKEEIGFEDQGKVPQLLLRDHGRGALTCITTLSSFWLSSSRILYGAAKQHQMTRRFATLNRNGQPQTANIVVGILSIYFTVFAPDEWVNYIYAIYGLAAGCVYLLVAVSFLRLRSAHPEWPRPYRIKAATNSEFIAMIADKLRLELKSA